MFAGLRRYLAGKRAAPTLGARGEHAAARLLRRAGYRVRARNLRRRIGEIDLLAEHRADHTLVVVEVKTTRRDDPPPEVHVNAAKQRKITAITASLIRERKLDDRLVRFDVVAVVWPEGAKRPTRVTHHVGAFEATI
jgi:putative endonuclease